MKILYLTLFMSLVVFSCKKEEPKIINSGDLDPIERPANSDIASNNNEGNKPNEPVTTIKFNQEDFDFGKISKSKKVQHYFSFTNTGENPATIYVRPTCGCTVSHAPEKPVLPGQTDSIALEFNPENFQGEVHKTATVTGNIKEPITLRFEANIQ